MAYGNTKPDASGSFLAEVVDGGGRQSVVGPLNPIRFRFLAGSSGVNPILSGVNGSRIKVFRLYAQNLSLLAGVTGTLRGNSDLGSVYFPKMSDTNAPLIPFVQGEITPLTLNFGEPLNLLLSDSRLVTGFGDYILDTW